MTRPILRLSKMLAVLSTVFATPALAMPSYTITPQVADNVFGSPNWSESARVNFDGDRYNSPLKKVLIPGFYPLANQTAAK